MDVRAALEAFLARPEIEQELRLAAEEHPRETWRALLAGLDSPLSDEQLSILAMDVLDSIRVYGGEALWNTVREEGAAHPQLSRAITSIDRYCAKYVVLNSLLADEATDDLLEEASDLPLPNTYQRSAIASRRGITDLTASERKAFLAGAPRVRWHVDQMVDKAPRQAWRLALTLLSEVHENQLGDVGIALLEGLITVREEELADLVIAEISTNVLLRKALSHTYLNPSERFMDQLILALRSAADGSP